MREATLDIYQECKVSDDQRVADLVLNESINVHKHDRYGWTLLSIAARYGKRLTANNLIEKRRANVNQANKHDKSTPMFWAAQEGDVEIVELLLSHDANPNKAKKNGMTPLLVAARERQDIVVTTLLASGKVNVDQKDADGRTALHYACESEPRSTAFVLIKHGASNLPDKDGVTPFHIVCRQKWEDIVDLLLSRIVAKGDTQLLYIRDQFDRLPIHYMVSLQFDQDKKRWRNPQHPSKFCLLSALFDLEKRNLKLLGQYPAKASFLVQDPLGHFPANQAVRFGSDHMVEMLTLADETNEIANNSGQSGYLPLHRALTISYQISKRVAIVELLLKAKQQQGFDNHKYHEKIIKSVRTPDPKGYYPLHLALKFTPSKKVIRLLLEADAHENDTCRVLYTPDPDGLIPLHTALLADDIDDEIVKMLIDYDTTGETVLIREPKSRKLAIHYAFENDLPSTEQLKILIDGDWENKSVYMRDGHGSNALHYLLKNQTKEDDPKEVAALAQLLLFQTEKVTFSKDVTSPQDRYSPLVTIVDRQTGMMPLHLAFKYGAPSEVIELLMQFEHPDERSIGPSLILDRSGKLPIHHACENPSTDPDVIYSLLKHSEQNTIFAMDKNKNLPFFMALKLEKADRLLLDALLPLRPKRQSSERTKRSSELVDRIYQPMAKFNVKDFLEKKIIAGTAFRGVAKEEAYEWLYRLCRRCKIEDYKVNEAIIATLDSQATIDWLNVKSSDRWSVFLLMSDMYAHIAWIVVFILASRAYLSNLYRDDDAEYRMFGWILLAVSAYFFLFREAIELVGNDSLWTYLKDPWNWFENATIGCVIASSIHFVSPAGPKQIEFLLITTGLFQFAFAVSFLRTTFLAYAQFVGGILNIFKELIPFFLVTGLILMAFTYAAFVQNFDAEDPETRENFKDFLESFLTLFGGFLGGPDPPKTVADILFGIISVVILLNVVIAIISNAWDDATGETTIRFWQYRIAFIQEVSYTKEVLTKPIQLFQCCVGGCREVKQQIYDQDDWAALSSRPERPTRLAKHSSMIRLQHHMKYPQDRNKPMLNAWEKFAFFLSYVLFFVLGLVSWGQAWPNRIRKDVFGRNKRTVVLKKEDKKVDSAKLDGIHRSVQQLSEAHMEERMKKVEAEMLRMKGTMEDVHDLLKKLAAQPMPDPQRD